MKLWDLVFGIFYKELRGYIDNIISFIFSLDSGLIVFVFMDNLVCVWDIRNIYCSVFVDGFFSEFVGVYIG